MKVSVEILDIAYGHPADGVLVRLDRSYHDGRVRVGNAVTDSEGRAEGWGSQHLESGLYRIAFDSDSYFAGFGASAGYPGVIIIFRVRNESKTCRIHARLSAHSYSTDFRQCEVGSGTSSPLFLRASLTRSCVSNASSVSCIPTSRASIKSSR